MRQGKELILATKPFAHENLFKSWLYSLSTLFFMTASFAAGFFVSAWYFQLPVALLSGLLMSRMFVIYHDNQHGAILHHSKMGNLMFAIYGLFALAPVSIWKRSHDHHHVHNSKLSNTGIGAYPTISVDMFNRLSKKERWIYLAARHPITVFSGYLTIFIYNLNIHSLMYSFRRHFDCGVALVLHVAASVCIYHFLGPQTYFLGWLLPFLTAHGMGAYLFYIQHNFPGAVYNEGKDWTYHGAALGTTSFVIMPKILHWFTGNIAYHHIHHLNVRIPFYRLPEVMNAIPELQNPKTIRWSIKDMVEAFRLKVWDSESGRMIGLK